MQSHEVIMHVYSPLCHASITKKKEHFLEFSQLQKSKRAFFILSVIASTLKLFEIVLVWIERYWDNVLVIQKCIIYSYDQACNVNFCLPYLCRFCRSPMVLRVPLLIKDFLYSKIRTYRRITNFYGWLYLESQPGLVGFHQQLNSVAFLIQSVCSLLASDTRVWIWFSLSELPAPSNQNHHYYTRTCM